MSAHPTRARLKGSRLCFSILVGASDASGRGKFSKKREAIIQRITEHHFPDGASIIEAQGTWFDPARRTFIKEEARQILVCAASKKVLLPWCKALVAALQQKELLIVQLGRATVFSAG